MFAIAVRFELHPGTVEAFDRMMVEIVERIRAEEPGTLVYGVCSVKGEDLARVFVEVYQDRDAFEAHMGQPHTVRFLSEREAYIKSSRVEFLTPIVAVLRPES